MTTRQTATLTAFAILILGTAGLAVANTGDPASGTPDICDGLDSGKIDTVGDPATVTLTAPPPALITEYCVKAGSAESGGGPVYVTVDPPQASLVISHPTGKAVSHFSFSYEGPSATTTLPETTLPTTVPETIVTVLETSTTAVEQTTTTAVTTTTQPVTTSDPEQSTTTSTSTPGTTTTTSVQATTTTVPPDGTTTTTSPRPTTPPSSRVTLPTAE